MPRPSPDISQSFDRVELGDLGKPRWRLKMAALFNYGNKKAALSFSLLAYYILDQKEGYFNVYKKTQSCVQTLAILMESF